MHWNTVSSSLPFSSLNSFAPVTLTQRPTSAQPLQNGEQRRSACCEADSVGKKESRERKGAKNHSTGYCHKHYGRCWFPGALSSQETRVLQNKEELCPCTRSTPVVYTASQAVRSRGTLRKKKERAPCRMPKVLHNRDEQNNIHIIGSHQGEVKNKFTVITSRFLAMETKYFPFFFTLQKRAYTHAHSTTPLPTGALVYRFGDEVEKALGVLLRMHRRDFCPCAVLHCLCCLRSAFLHTVMCEHVH